MVSIRVSDEPLKNMVRQSSKILEQLHGKTFFGFLPNETWTPSVNLYETDAMYIVCVELAGVDKKKIDIEVKDGRLTLRGSRAIPSCHEISGEPARAKVHVMEIDHGGFARDVELPRDVHCGQIKASYVDGMLWIELPKTL